VREGRGKGRWLEPGLLYLYLGDVADVLSSVEIGLAGFCSPLRDSAGFSPDFIYPPDIVYEAELPFKAVGVKPPEVRPLWAPSPLAVAVGAPSLLGLRPRWGSFKAVEVKQPGLRPCWGSVPEMPEMLGMGWGEMVH
jgi:hypothetical protein